MRAIPEAKAMHDHINSSRYRCHHGQVNALVVFYPLLRRLEGGEITVHLRNFLLNRLQLKVSLAGHVQYLSCTDKHNGELASWPIMV